MFAEIVAAAFICTPVSVWDGDGPIRCAQGYDVRLWAVSARERDETCREAHPCPEAGGMNAARHLAELTGEIIGVGPNGHFLVEGPAMWCERKGESYGRIVARCESLENGDLGCRMVMDGFALEWRRYGRVCVFSMPSVR